MITHLTKSDNGSWVVFKHPILTSFKTIEKASDYLMANGIVDEDIDDALIQLHTLGHNEAQFDETGKFIFSQEA